MPDNHPPQISPGMTFHPRGEDRLDDWYRHRVWPGLREPEALVLEEVLRLYLNTQGYPARGLLQLAYLPLQQPGVDHTTPTTLFTLVLPDGDYEACADVMASTLVAETIEMVQNCLAAPWEIDLPAGMFDPHHRSGLFDYGTASGMVIHTTLGTLIAACAICSLYASTVQHGLLFTLLGTLNRLYPSDEILTLSERHTRWSDLPNQTDPIADHRAYQDACTHVTRCFDQQVPAVKAWVDYLKQRPLLTWTEAHINNLYGLLR